MIGNLVSNLKSRLTIARISDEPSRRNFAYSTDESPSFLNKLMNASYALVSQKQDDAYCSENLFMLPRVYSHGNGSDSIEPCRSPISLQPPEKSLDELDNIVEKFLRCINLENGCEYDGNRKNDREAIRRRLAMGEEDDYLAAAQHRPVRKPNLQSRLQSGQNLQICFMNEAASDSESSDSETCPKLSQGMSRRKHAQQRSSSLMSHRSTALNNNPYSSRPLSVAKSVMDRTERAERPATLALNVNDTSDNNFFTQQARLQIEARMALAQAKDIAHMQMEFERQKQAMCPITELVHQTLDKVGMKVPPTKRRLSRQLLTNMNIAQLQIIINEFHSFIETLNETLVRYLMDRDDLSMRQDSLLIDIEDITRYLAEKEEVKLNSTPQSVTQHLDPKKAAPQRTTVIRYQQYPPSFLQNYNNPHKKSLMVNGNGHSSVITREKFDHRNRLHL